MSKIFEALNKGQGEAAELILPLVEAQNGRAEPGTDSPAITASRTAPEESITYLPSASAGAHLDAVRALPLKIASPSPLLPFESGNWQASEQYRIIRTRIVQHPKEPRVILVSSAGAADGKSITAINLSGALALKSEAKVLLVDADLRRSSIHVQLGLPEGPGLTEVLAGSCSLEQAIIRIDSFDNLYVIAAGSAKANPAELLDNPRWPALCARLRKSFRYVILDSPPIGAVADYDLIQAVCDGVIMVVRPDHTNRRLCLKALKTVPKDKLIGILLNCVSNWFLGRYTSPDYYYCSGNAQYDRTR